MAMNVNQRKQQLVLDFKNNTTTPATLRVCLEYLFQVAMNSNLLLPAELIGAAVVACKEEESAAVTAN